jgi:hypothetical protein
VGVRCLRRVRGVTRSDDGYFGGRLLALCRSVKMGGAMMGAFFGGGRGG